MTPVPAGHRLARLSGDSVAQRQLAAAVRARFLRAAEERGDEDRRAQLAAVREASWFVCHARSDYDLLPWGELLDPAGPTSVGQLANVEGAAISEGAASGAGTRAATRASIPNHYESAAPLGRGGIYSLGGRPIAAAARRPGTRSTGQEGA